MSRCVYIDAGVLIAAARGKNEIAQRAMEVLDNPDAVFASSLFVKLETLPKAIYQKKTEESLFYELFFASVTTWCTIDDELVEIAYDEAKNAGISAMDALHIAAAIRTGAQELVTSEKQTSPIHRSKRITVKSIVPENAS